MGSQTRSELWEAINVSGGGYEGDVLTLLSYKLGELKEGDHMAKS